MLRARLTGTIATADTEQAQAHGLGVAPDCIFVVRRTTAAGAAPSVEGGDTGNINSSNATNVFVHCTSAATLYTVLAVAWQGRSY